MRRLLGHDDFEIVVALGTPHRVILETARRRRASMIVVGPTHRSRAAEVLPGSSAKQVIRHADVPVLVARTSPTSGPVIVATDLSDMARPALLAGAAEARRRDSELLAIHAVDLRHPLQFVEPDRRSRLHEHAYLELAAALARAGVSGEAQVVDGEARQAIVESAERKAAQLLVVATHGRTGLSWLAMGSEAFEIVTRAPCSTLVVRSHP